MQSNLSVTFCVVPPGSCASPDGFASAVSLSCPEQGSCLQSEDHLSLQINLSARGDRPADLDKLKPYVIEHILVLLAAPTAGPAAIGAFVSGFMFVRSSYISVQLKKIL